MLTSAFVSFVSCLDACLDAVGVQPPLGLSTWVMEHTLAAYLSDYEAETFM
jgi:hypothetical protein